MSNAGGLEGRSPNIYSSTAERNILSIKYDTYPTTSILQHIESATICGMSI